MLQYSKTMNAKKKVIKAGVKNYDKEFMHLATLEPDSYEVIFGSDKNWSKPFFFEFTPKMLELYIVNDLNPNDPKAVQIIDSIKKEASRSIGSFKFLIDLSSSMNGTRLNSDNYSHLISTLGKLMLYQVIYTYY